MSVADKDIEPEDYCDLHGYPLPCEQCRALDRAERAIAKIEEGK